MYKKIKRATLLEKPRRIQITVRMTEDEAGKLQQHAMGREMSISDFVRERLKRWTRE